MPLNERTINSARNPRWANLAKTSIDLEVDFDELDEEYVEFNAHPDDICSWGSELFNRAVAGEFGEIAEFEVPPPITKESNLEGLKNCIRRERDEILKEEVDPIVTNPLRWDSLDDEKQQEWRDYRQALLDLTDNIADDVEFSYSDEEGFNVLKNLSLPTKPE